jgi:uncharacterized repeat protein (TIGR01451 family)
MSRERTRTGMAIAAAFTGTAIFVASLTAPGPTSSGLGVSRAEAQTLSCQAIDVFDDPPGQEQVATTPVVITVPATATNAGGDSNSILGGERDLVITKTFPALQSNRAEARVAGGAFDWANDSGLPDAAVVSNGSITWDGPDGDASNLNPTGLGGVDLSREGASGAFSFQIVGWDRGTVTFTFQVWSGPTAVSSQEVTLPEQPNGALVRFPISGFARLAGAASAADISRAGAIVLRFSTPDSSEPNQQIDLAFDDVMGPCRPAAAQPDLRLAKKATKKSVPAGGTVGWKLTVRNRGQAAAENVSLCDKLPGDLTVVKLGGGKLIKGKKVCWTFGIAAGKKTSRSLKVRIDPDAPKSVKNRAVLSAAGISRRSDRASVRVTSRGGQSGPSPVTG